MAYATVDDFEAYLDGEALPSNAARLLDTASDLIDDMLVGAIYDVDENGDPTDPADIATLKKATCAQAQYLAMLGDETGAQANFASASAGAVSFSRMIGSSPSRTIVSARYAPQAVSILRTAGFLPVGVLQPGWVADEMCCPPDVIE